MKYKLLNISAAVLLGLYGALPTTGLAQTDTTFDRGFESQQEALRSIEAIEEGYQLETDASRYQKIKGGPVSLAEVMKNPDNNELNFRYAQTQVADGNLRGAGATLERMLMINPNLHHVRLYYVQILYRLDNTKEAQAQLAQLDGKRLSPQNQARVDNLRSRIERRERRTVYTARLGAGFTYQDNANFAPDDEAIDVIVPTPFGPIQISGLKTPDADREDDIAFLGTASLGVRHDLGYQQRHEAFGNISMVWNEQDQVSSTDYVSLTGDGGILWRMAFADLTGRVFASHLELDNDNFLDTFGIEGKLDREFMHGRLNASLRHRITHEDYDHADGYTPERTGKRYVTEAAARYKLRGDQILGGAIQYTDKNADADWREYTGWQVTVDHTWLMGRGSFLKNQLSYGEEDYNDANPRISTRERDDEEWRYRLSYSTPLKNLIDPGVLPHSFRDLRLNAALQYTDVSSNIRNYDHDNTKVSVFISKRFDF